MSTPTDISRDQITVLGPSLRFKGELRAEEEVFIKGHVEGTIKHVPRLTVCREGIVNASIQGSIVAVLGTVTGDIEANTSVSIAEYADMTGDIVAPSVSLVEGSRFNGSVTMGARVSRADPPEPERKAPIPPGPNPTPIRTQLQR